MKKNGFRALSKKGGDLDMKTGTQWGWNTLNCTTSRAQSTKRYETSEIPIDKYKIILRIFYFRKPTKIFTY